MGIAEIPTSPAPTIEQTRPSLPRSAAGLSYWHRDTQNFRYLDHNASSPVPEHVQLVIIGSGLSGALTAFELLDAGFAANEILLLEARQAVSGSTGRNAGHIRPDAFRLFSTYASAHGIEQALNIVKNENYVLKAWDLFIQKHQIPCEFSVKQTFDVCLTEEIAAEEARYVKDYIDAGGSMDCIRVYGPEAATKRLGIKDVVAAYQWTAASIHPVKLVQCLLSRVIDQGVHFWAHCPVTAVVKDDGADDNSWIVHTPCGNVSTRRVVHCTNAHAGVLLPQLSLPYITPIRVQVQSLVMPVFAGDQMLETTMALRYKPQLFYGLTQMQSDGRIICSVGKPSGISFDESSYLPELIEETINVLDSLFPMPEKARRAFQHGEGLDHVWTGLIAMTPDKVPDVGVIT